MSVTLHFKYLAVLSVLVTSAASYANDPTRPLTQALPLASKQKAAKSPFQLQSIVVRNAAKKAVIAGNLYQVGDEIAGFTLVRITKRSVLLKRGLEEKKLELYPYDIKN